jgi:hypothetical protein
MIGFASLPVTLSSTMLVSDATGVERVMLSGVSAGIVTSRNSGSAGAAVAVVAGAAAAPDAPG